jgi:hypothetical protein
MMKYPSDSKGRKCRSIFGALNRRAARAPWLPPHERRGRGRGRNKGYQINIRGRWYKPFIGALAAVLLAGCAGQTGIPVTGPLGGDLDYAYLPLKGTEYLLMDTNAGGVVLGGGVAVTAAHSAHMVYEKNLIGVSTEYDLAFFRTDKSEKKLETGEPQLGEQIVSYAHDGEQTLRAEGVVTQLDVPVKPRCETCTPAITFIFEGNAGPGFSGGPVLDAKSGKLVGIVFGYLNGENGKNAVYAYSMKRVMEELEKVRKEPTAKADHG